MSGYSRGSVAIAICDRCKMQMPYSRLRPDGDKPGLRVCKGCCDVKDPWRLPRPREKPITLRYPRPDLQLTIPPDIIASDSEDSYTTEDGNSNYTTEDGDSNYIPTNTPTYTTEDGLSSYVEEDGSTIYTPES